MFLSPTAIQAQSVKIVLPERFRLLSDQLFDLRVEARIESWRIVRLS